MQYRLVCLHAMQYSLVLVLVCNLVQVLVPVRQFAMNRVLVHMSWPVLCHRQKTEQMIIKNCMQACSLCDATELPLDVRCLHEQTGSSFGGV